MSGGGGGGRGAKAAKLLVKKIKKSLGLQFTADKNDSHLLTAVSGPATKASLSILKF